MTPKQFQQLRRGDILRHLTTGNNYVIDNTIKIDGKPAYVGIDSILITNPDEWVRCVKTDPLLKPISQEQINKLKRGVYRIHWINGDKFSVGTIYQNTKGERILHCANWINTPDIISNTSVWDVVERVELIEESP